ncbi:MAG: hypothetical protein GY849_15825 [Deltaproteobacteria bacterium]|nr:hypothetical protein [Deltaproteobacteria bacterium]
MPTKRTRGELRQLFRKGAKPTEEVFGDLFESFLNAKDDGVEKPRGEETPLKITAQGVDQNILDFYDDQSLSWRISQNSGDKSGLSVSSGSGDSRLFIEAENGNIGMGSSDPAAKLHVVQSSATQNAFRVDDKNSDATPFIINAGGTVGIGTADPDPNSKAEVNGDLKVKGLTIGEVSVDEISDDDTMGGREYAGKDADETSKSSGDASNKAVPTELAVRKYVDTRIGEAKDFARQEALKTSHLTWGGEKSETKRWSGDKIDFTAPEGSGIVGMSISGDGDGKIRSITFRYRSMES